MREKIINILKKMNMGVKVNIGLVIFLISVLCTFIVDIFNITTATEVGQALLLMSMGCKLIAYILVGGPVFVAIFRIIKKMCISLWFMFPFPIDLLVIIFCFAMLLLIVSLLFTVIPFGEYLIIVLGYIGHFEKKRKREKSQIVD